MGNQIKILIFFFMLCKQDLMTKDVNSWTNEIRCLTILKAKSDLFEGTTKILWWK